jgi:predicted phage terminase large subunit-like protein
VFPSGARVRFAHMQYEDDRYDWDGSQLPLVMFDQLESFTWKQFWHIISRLRSTCGVRPYVRGTCNPDPDHWLRKFLDWWIDKETGLAIEERSGVIRWFVVINDEVHWGDSRQELLDRLGDHVLPLSFTFIPGILEENKALLDKNPAYVAWLDALPKVERERLKGGNWNIRETAGSFFQKQWFGIVKAAPALEMEIRYWDRAATEHNPTGSWTAGLRMGRVSVGSGYQYYIRHVARFQGTPLVVETGVKNIAAQDGPYVLVRVEQDPGQAGVAEAGVHVRNLAGLDVKAIAAREKKGRRARGLSAQAEAGNVFLVEGDWNEAFLDELEKFDGSGKCQSDQVDAASGAFNELASVVYAGVWGN